MLSAKNLRFRMWAPLGLLTALIVWPGCSGSAENSDDDATVGDDDATVGDDDTTVGDDDTTGDDDDASHPGPGDDDDVSIPPNLLEEGDWFAATHDAISSFAEANGGASDKALPVVVMEFENTSIFNAIGPMTFRYQVLNLAFKVTPEELANVIPTSAASDYYAPYSVSSVSSTHGDVSLEDLQHDIVSSYDYLYGKAESLGCKSGCSTLDQLKATDEYLDFVAKMLFMYQALTDSPEVGPDFTSPIITQLLGGFTETEARDLGTTVYASELEAEVRLVTVTGPQPDGNTAVPYQITTSFVDGIRAIPEMLDLYGYLRRAGFDIWIVTASAQVIVQGAANTTGGYGIQPDHVIGIRLEPGHAAPGQKNPPMTTALKAGAVVPYSQGKVKAIQEIIQADPLVVVGSDGMDYEMLTAFPGALNLVINRNQGCPISQLYQKAKTSGGTDKTHYLLQGLDENEGAFRPAQETVDFDASSAQPIPGSADCSD